MKIKKLELKNFGKFNNKNIQLQDGIQLIYGENEAGKSTMHTFIKGMLFGMERGRGRASVNDTFSRYEPWENPNYYAGAMSFESGGKTFCLERNFDKYSRGARLFCEEDGEELSVEDGDLEMVLSGLGGAGYEDTLYIGQLRSKTSQSLGSELKNYATNYYTVGDSEIDLAAAQSALQLQKKELDRTVRRSLEEKQMQRERVEQEASYVWRDVHRLEKALEEAEEGLERQQRQKEDCELGAEQSEGEPKGQRWRVHPVEVLLMLASVIAIFVVFSRPWNYLVAIIAVLVGGIYIWNRLKEGKKRTNIPPGAELEDVIAEEEANSAQRLLWKKAHLGGELKEKQIEYENIREQLEELDEISEEYKEQDKRRAALVLANQRMEELSQEMQIQMSRDLNNLASTIIESVTGGKYTRLTVDEDLHMSLISCGKKIAMEQVSQGTLEQIYFALRMAVSQLLHDEEYPVILDDTFAFYDDARMERTLKWLAKHKSQVIIFSCQKREEEALKRLGVMYHKVMI